MFKRLGELLANITKVRERTRRSHVTVTNLISLINRPHVVPANANTHPGSTSQSNVLPQEKSAVQAMDRLARILAQQSNSLDPSVSNSLDSSDWSQRRDAVLSLLHENAHFAIPHLLKALDDDDSHVRIAAVQTLEKFGTESALRGLFRALSDENYLVCDAASDALSAVGRQAVPHLLQALRSANVNTRGAAIEALEKIADPSTVPNLIACLSDLENPWLSNLRVCDLAARALETIGSAESLQAVQEWRAPNLLEVGSEADHMTSLDTVMQSQEDHDSDSEKPAILDEILANLRSEDWAVRQESAKALREYAKLLKGTRNLSVIRHLLESLHDEDWGVRWAIVEALAWLGDPAAVPMLIDRLNDEHWPVRVAVLRALLEIQDSKAVPDIIKALSDPHNLVREAAAEALGRLGTPSAIPFLEESLNDTENFVRLAVVEAMGHLKDGQAIPSLKKALCDDDNHIRWSAVIALGEIADETTVPALIEKLQDTNGPFWEEKRICDVAADVLENFGTEAAISAVNQWRELYSESV